MARKLPRNINLLDPTAAPKNTWDKIYDWVFNAGRYIIVAVEFVVLVAFGSRFYLDRVNNDLKESISAKVSILDSQERIEEEIRNVYIVLSDITRMSNEQVIISKMLDDVMDGITSGIKIQTFSADLDGVRMSCVASDYEKVEKIENYFRDDPKYENVNVSLNKSGSEASNVEFTMTFDFVIEDEVIAPAVEETEEAEE